MSEERDDTIERLRLAVIELCGSMFDPKTRTPLSTAIFTKARDYGGILHPKAPITMHYDTDTCPTCGAVWRRGSF